MSKQVKQLNLPSHIKTLCRLIQQKEIRLLRQGKSNLDALAFASAKFIEDAVSEIARISKIKSVVGSHPIFSR